MNRRSSLSNRLSLSTTNLSNPIVESTHVNGSSTPIKFPWGGKLVSPTKPSNLSVQRGTPMVAMSPINKIDPRVYIDVQSKGLASRIVKYHENSNKLNRSLSTGNLYNKPGQYPVIHLKKKEITYKPSRNQNVSMVRIAPPDKSVFQANTRSSILRTGSIVPTVSLQMNNEQISGENRPILHPAGNDIAPTRSVLDALREISRKRINSDELDCCDNIKKYCKESDEVNGNERPAQVFNNSSMSKRQREGPSSPNSKINASPEQVSKKRMCSRNNDVTSSLSSSLTITPKRKFDDVHTGKGIEKFTKSDSPTPPKSKQQCYDSDYAPLENIETILSGEITPLPPTPAVEPMKLKETTKSLSEQSFPVGNEKTKPKLTLFNKNYNDSPVTKIVHNFVSKFEDNDFPGIPFVKPKSNSQISAGINPIIERTKKSKLALMLSGLSGELNEDEGDSVQQQIIEPKDVIEKNSATIVVPATVRLDTPATSSASISFETKTTTSTTPIPAVTQVSIKDQNTTEEKSVTDSISERKTTTTPAIATISPSTHTQSFATSLPTATMATTAKGFAFPPVVNKVPSKECKPVSAGLPFGSQNTSTVATTTNSTSVSSQLSAAVVPVSNMPVSTTPTFSFGKTTGSITSVTALPFSVSASEDNTITGKTNFGFPKTSQSFTPSLFGNASADSIGSSNNSHSKSNMNFENLATGPKTTFALSSTKQTEGVASVPTSTMAVITTSNTSGHQLGSLSTPQKSVPGFNGNTTFASTNSGSTSSTTTTFGTSPGSLKPSSNLFANKSPGGGFSFTASNQTASPIKSNSNTPFAANSNQNTPTTTSGFSFSTSASIKGGFPFGSSIPVPSSSSSTTTNTFSFGANSSKQSGFSLSGTTSCSTPQNLSITSKSFPFSGISSQQGITTNSSTEKISQSQSNPFSVGGQQTTESGSIFGANQTENKLSNAFVFGNPSPNQIPTTTSSAFSPAPSSFGAIVTTSNARFNTPTTTSNVVFGAPATTMPNSTFGALAATISNKFGTPVNSNSTFGSPATISNSAFGTPRTTFGQSTTIAPAFGMPTTTFTSAFSSSTENKPGAFVFGAAASNVSGPTKSFSFGGNTAIAAPSGVLVLNPSNAAENKNLFATPVSTSKTFNFGSTSNNCNDKSVFETTSNNNSNPTAISPFGTSSSNQSKSFTFTAGTNGASPNLFGTSGDNQTNKPFAFGSSSVPASNNNNNNNNSQYFAFGGSAPSPTNFAFNAQSSTATGSMSDVNKTFNFGGPPNQVASKQNAFGVSNTPQFNFPVGSNVNAANSNTTNPFNMAPSSSTTTAGDRPIMKATRRLAK